MYKENKSGCVCKKTEMNPYSFETLKNISKSFYRLFVFSNDKRQSQNFL